jgi:hypothetical protein
MNKLVAAIVVAIVAVGGGAYILAHNSDTTTKTTTKASDISQTTYEAVDACDVLTEAVASQVLGASPTKVTDVPSAISSQHLSGSKCTYYYQTAAGRQTVDLLVQSAKDQSGAESNQTQFAELPSDSQWVAGYGAKAYWNARLGQLNVLNNDNWYVLSHYSGTGATSSTLDQAKVLADAVQGNLK